MLDEDQAKMYAPIVKQKDEGNPDDGSDGGGQGFGQGKMDSAIETDYQPIIQSRKQRRRKGR